MTTTLPVERQTLETIWSLRERAVKLRGDAWDAERASIQAAADAIGHVPAREQGERLKPSESQVEGRETYVREFQLDLDRTIWKRLIAITDLEQLMDRQARDEFSRELHDNPPEPTPDNVRATIGGLMERRGDIFRRGIANVFSGLDRRFRSHDGFKVGARIILSGALSEFGWNYGRRHDEIWDVEKTFYVLDGKPAPATSELRQVCAKPMRERPFMVETAYFRVRGFQNGNIHLWLTRPDLVRKVNRLLADFYGEAIGEGADVADVSDMGPSYHVTPARDFGLFESPAGVVERVFEDVGGIDKGERVLEPSAGRGALADEARRLGGVVTCVEIQRELAVSLRDKRHRVVNRDFLELTPADLGLFDVVVMNPPFDRGRDCDHVRHALQFLKPGGRLVSVMSARTEFAEDKRTAAFRALVEKLPTVQRWGGGRWRDLPAGSFSEAGTMVNTLTLAVRTETEAARKAA